MAVPLCRLRGTWDEIAARVPDFGRQRLSIVVFPEQEDTENENAMSGEDPLGAVLRDIEERSRTMNPKPDDRDYLREARSGAMFSRQGDAF